MDELENFVLEYVDERMEKGETLEEALGNLYNEVQEEILSEEKKNPKVNPVYKAYKKLKQNNPLTAKYDNKNDQDMQKYAAKAVSGIKRFGKGIWDLSTKTPSFRTADDFIAHWGSKIGGMRQAKRDRVQGEWQKRKAETAKIATRKASNEKAREERRKGLGLTPQQINKASSKLKGAFKKKASAVKQKPSEPPKPEAPKQKSPTKTALKLTQSAIKKSNVKLNKDAFTKKKLLDKASPAKTPKPKKDKPVDPANPMPNKPRKPRQKRLPGF